MTDIKLPPMPRPQLEKAGWTFYDDSDMEAYAREAVRMNAQAVPDEMVLIPKRLTKEMESVINDEDWQWEDFLAAAEAITLDEYSELVAAAPQPAQAEQTDARDAARWRYIAWHIGVAWNEQGFTSLVRIVSDKHREMMGDLVDRMMAGDWPDAAPAAPAAPQPAEQIIDDGMPASSDERHLRRLLAARAAMPNTYFDDGEAHGAEHGIQIDFMREPVAHIDAKLRALNVARLAVAAPQPAQPLTDEQRKFLRFLVGSDDWDGVWFGEPHPTKKGVFWWRRDMRKVFYGIGVKT